MERQLTLGVMVTDEELTAVALRIYTAIAKNDGLSRVDAEEKWRALGPKGRGQWRNVAKVAAEAIDKKPNVSAEKPAPAKPAMPQRHNISPPSWPPRQ